MGRYEPGARLYVVNPTFGRIASALVATTLDLTQKIMAKPNIVATIAKLVFLRMGASDLDRSDSRCNGPNIAALAGRDCDLDHTAVLSPAGM